MSALSVPRYWRESKYLYKLIGSKCKKCGKIHFPHRAVCRNCHSQSVENHKLSARGKVLTYTIVRSAPEGYEKMVPYAVGIIELEDGIRVLSQVVDCNPEEIKIGMPVELTFRKVKEDGQEGIIEYGYKFRPVFEQ